MRIADNVPKKANPNAVQPIADAADWERRVDAERERKLWNNHVVEEVNLAAEGGAQDQGRAV